MLRVHNRVVGDVSGVHYEGYNKKDAERQFEDRAHLSTGTIGASYTGEQVTWYRDDMVYKQIDGKQLVETVKTKRQPQSYVQLTHCAMRSMDDTYYCPACITPLWTTPVSEQMQTFDHLMCTSCPCKTVYNLQGEIVVHLSIGEEQHTK